MVAELLPRAPLFHGQRNGRACRGIFVAVGKEPAEAFHPSRKVLVHLPESQTYAAAGAAIGLAVKGDGLPLGCSGNKLDDAAPFPLLEHHGIFRESVAPEKDHRLGSQFDRFCDSAVHICILPWVFAVGGCSIIIFHERLGKGIVPVSWKVCKKRKFAELMIERLYNLGT